MCGDFWHCPYSRSTWLAELDCFEIIVERSWERMGGEEDDDGRPKPWAGVIQPRSTLTLPHTTPGTLSQGFSARLLFRSPAISQMPRPPSQINTGSSESVPLDCLADLFHGSRHARKIASAQFSALRISTTSVEARSKNEVWEGVSLPSPHPKHSRPRPTSRAL